MKSSYLPYAMKLRHLSLSVALLLPVSMTASGAAPTGLFVGTALNRYPLPRVERVPSQDGWEHWFKLERANITLRPDGRFIASFKYYRQHVKPKSPVRPGPLLNETYKGKFAVKGTQITFTPDPNKRSRRPPPIVGVISGDRMQIPYIVAEGQSKHPLRLDMKRTNGW